VSRAQTILLYAATDCGKTSQLGEMAQWEFARSGRVSRLISADSTWDPLVDMVSTPERPLGMKYRDLDGREKTVCIQAWNIQGLVDPWSVLVALSEGAWPEVVTEDEDRLRLRMIAPIWKEGWLMTDDGFQVAQVFNEGLSTFASLGMLDHTSTGRKTSQDVVGLFSSKVIEVFNGRAETKEFKFSAAAPSHYGQVQRFLLDDLVPRFGRLKVPRVVWTAHEAKGRDAVTGIDKSALGVDAGGPAVVDKTVQKFAHSFHLTVNTGFVQAKPPASGQVIQREFRAWFVQHPDETLNKMYWPAKVSLSISRAQELLKKYPGGFISLTGGSLTEYLDFVAAIPVIA
jgi:hypothetical protein